MAVLTPSWILDGVILLVSAFCAAFLYMTRNFNYWANRGVTEEKPLPFVGNFFASTFFEKSASDVMEDIYLRHKGHNQVGFYIYDKPSLLVRDLDLISRVLVKEFNTFPNRYITTGDHDPLGSANLFSLKNPPWRTVRTKLSPTMTSGKLKQMFHLMVDVASDFNAHLESRKLEGEGQVVEMREICARFTTDVIATCAYGVQANCLKNPDAEFRKYGRKIFEPGFKRALELAAIYYLPAVVKPLRLMMFEKSTSEFLRKALWDTLTHRMETGIRRNDLIDTLIDLKKAQAQVDIDDTNSFKFDGDNLTAQCAIYFTGGFETTASTISFALYELALAPDIQSRLREEITSALEENGGELKYEWVTQLPYLDMVVSETLRKYPIVGFLERVAISDHNFRDGGLVVEKDTPVFISVAGLHHDPEYFPDPEKYDPERFNSENKQKRPSYVYMPFGDGPRNCIGLRFGLLVAKIGLIETILNYKFTPCKNTPQPMPTDPGSPFTTMLGGLLLNVQKVTTTIQS